MDPRELEAFAAELASFTDDQLRAELESIALSVPGVAVVAASCRSGQCRGAAESAQRDPLDRFVTLARARFKGFVMARQLPDRLADGQPLLRTELEVKVP